MRYTFETIEFRDELKRCQGNAVFNNIGLIMDYFFKCYPQYVKSEDPVYKLTAFPYAYWRPQYSSYINTPFILIKVQLHKRSRVRSFIWINAKNFQQTKDAMRSNAELDNKLSLSIRDGALELDYILPFMVWRGIKYRAWDIANKIMIDTMAEFDKEFKSLWDTTP